MNNDHNNTGDDNTSLEEKLVGTYALIVRDSNHYLVPVKNLVHISDLHKRFYVFSKNTHQMLKDRFKMLKDGLMTYTISSIVKNNLLNDYAIVDRDGKRHKMQLKHLADLLGVVEIDDLSMSMLDTPNSINALINSSFCGTGGAGLLVCFPHSDEQPKIPQQHRPFIPDFDITKEELNETNPYIPYNAAYDKLSSVASMESLGKPIDLLCSGEQSEAPLTAIDIADMFLLNELLEASRRAEDANKVPSWNAIRNQKTKTIQLLCNVLSAIKLKRDGDPRETPYVESVKKQCAERKTINVDLSYKELLQAEHALSLIEKNLIPDTSEYSQRTKEFIETTVINGNVSETVSELALQIVLCL